MTRRRWLGLGLLGAILVIVEIWGAMQLTTRRVAGTPQGEPTSRPEIATGAVSSPATVDPPIPLALSAERDGDRRLAEVLGLRLFACPTPAGWPMRDWSTILPSGEDAAATWFSTDEEAGANVVFVSFEDVRPRSVLRWWTEPDGTTRCVEEPAEPQATTVGVVDDDGRPVPGVNVYVKSAMTGSLPTGPDGTLRFDLYNGQVGTVELNVGRHPLEPVRVRAGDTVTVQRSIPDGDPTEEEMSGPHRREIAAQALAVLDGLDTVLADPNLPPPVRGALVQRREHAQLMSDRAMTWFNPDGSLAPVVVQRLPGAK